MKQTAWSYSRLSAYELCPMKYQQESVTKKYPFETNAAAEFGKYAHKAFENRIVKGTKLPMDLTHHEKFLAPILTLKGKHIGEQRIALNANLEPTGFFDNDVWVRAIVDYAHLDTDVAIIADWKFGRRYDGFDQVDLMVAMMLAYEPEKDLAVGAYYWAKEKSFARKTYVRDDMATIWTGFIPRVNRYDKAHKEIDFPAKANFLCKKYCPVKDCKYWGI